MKQSPSNNWIFKVATICGCSIKVHLSFLFAILAIFLFQDPHSFPLENVIYFSLGFLVLTLFKLCIVLWLHWIFKALPKEVIVYPCWELKKYKEPLPSEKLQVSFFTSGPFFWYACAIIFSYLSQFSVLELSFNNDSEIRILAQVALLLSLISSLPFFPFDGGNLLFEYLKKTTIKNPKKLLVSASQIFYVLTFLSGILSSQYILCFLSAVLFANLFFVRLRTDYENFQSKHTIQDIMIPKDKLISFSHGSSLKEVLPQMISSPQQFFPVILEKELLGIISKDEAINGLIQSEGDGLISEFTKRDFVQSTISTSISELFANTDGSADNVIAIMRKSTTSDTSEKQNFHSENQNEFLGFVYMHLYSELIIIEKLLRKVVETSQVNNDDTIS